MNRFTVRQTLPAILLFAFSNALSAQNNSKSPYGNYNENGLPFFGQPVDARKFGDDAAPRNLTPRGIVIDLGYGYHACFDPDLLRLALLWRRDADRSFLAMNGMAPGSYQRPHRKAPAGQNSLPVPRGTAILVNGLYPGVHRGEIAIQKDPRSPGLDAEDPGRGPLGGSGTKWLGLRLELSGPVLCYQFEGTSIEERWDVLELAEDGPKQFVRIFEVAPHPSSLTFSLSRNHSFTAPPSRVATRWASAVWLPEGNLIEPSSSPIGDAPAASAPSPRRWKTEVRLPFPKKQEADAPFLVDDLPLPLPNPWKRNVRPSDFDFFADGRLAMTTFDGDVWIADDLTGKQSHLTWRRFASGLHEPMGLRIVEGNIIVFDRSGLVRLIDNDKNGEADYYENFCSLPAQTAETREFAMSMELKPGGGFYLSKGGQAGGPRGKLNGSIVEVSADGKTMVVVATGLRQPFLGVDPKTGVLTASDQQGHWVPATPIHTIKAGSYYGFQPARLGAGANEGKTITEPPLWLPHFVNQSGARQIWLRQARMGTLNESLIHLGYNQPAIFKIYLDAKGEQGAAAPLLDGFPTGLLGGRVNPVDGLLYLGGLNLWGTTGKQIQGLYRIRPTDTPSYLPTEVRAFKEGVVLRFAHPLDHAHATRLAHYNVDRWNYKRSNKYGSGHFKPDGTPGQEPLAVSCLYISEDHQSVFLGIPRMEPVHSLRVTFQIKPKLSQSVYLSMSKLHPVNLTDLGFEETEIELTPNAVATGPKRLKPTATLGREVATRYGCLACHGIDESKKVAEEPTLVVGPSWKGLYGARREFTDGSSLPAADRNYLRQSILKPSSKVTKGFETNKTGVGMPSYLGVLNDDQIESLILYIKSLN